MSASIIKVHPDHDLYVRFSTVVMGITHEGTRAELLADERIDEAAMDRAERTGTSDPPGDYQEYAWGSHDPVFNDDAVFLVSDLPSLYGISGTRG